MNTPKTEQLTYSLVGTGLHQGKNNSPVEFQ